MVLAVTALTAAVEAAAQYPSPERCVTSSLATLSPDGTLMTQTAQDYQLLGQDFIDPGKWRRGARLRICLNRQDSSSEKFLTVDIMNLDRDESLVAVHTPRP